MPTAFADLVLTGTRVWVGDGSSTDAIAVRDGVVVAHGDEQVRELVGPRTEMLHGTGGLVVPGFQDGHCHPAPAGYERGTVDLHGLGSRQAHLDAVAAYCAAHPDAEWIVGGGWALDDFPGANPLRTDLDEVTGGRPAFLFNRDVHGAWANTAALRLAGIDASTPDPSDGRYERDETGMPSGMLHEGAAYTFRDRWVPQPTQQDWEDAILASQQYFFSLGITGFQDAWVTPETFAAYRSLGDSGRLKAHVVGALWWDRHSGLDQIPQFLTQREQGAGRFRPTTVKIMVDGTVENRTASLIDSYCGCDSPEFGLDYVDHDLLCAALTELDALGFQVHMHAIGDRAVRNALDAVAAARAANGTSDNRHQIAHLQIVQPDDVRRFADLDVIANCQTFWACHEPQMDDLTIPIIGPERTAMQYPFASLQRVGARLAMGSDWAVSTPDPLQQMEVAVRRTDPDHPGNDAFLPEERISLETALTGFTSGTAFANHDDTAGRLTLGARADLAVLDQDLFDLDGRISTARVTCAVASGEVVHRV